MGIYERFNVKSIINVAGTVTRYGGSLMDRETIDAMVEAARYSIRLDELQAAAGKIIAERTHAEMGIVTSGAFAALLLGIAACICGFDVARMNRLPDTQDIPNEVIMPWHQISGYSHAIKAAGGKLIGVGIPNDTTPPNVVYETTRRDVESAVTEKTVAIVYAVRPGSMPPLEEVIEIGKKYNVPVIIDAAAQVPPVKNLYHFIDMGADIVCFSGGKGIRGPQASGILCGKRHLVSSAAIQMLDMAGEDFDAWNPPVSLIPKEELRGKPEHGIGRGMKVSKEAIIGLLVALENLTEDEFSARKTQQAKLLEHIAQYVENLDNIDVKLAEDPPGGYPILEVEIKGRTATDVFAIFERLKDKGVYARDKRLKEGVLIIHSINLSESTADLVGEILRDTIIG